MKYEKYLTRSSLTGHQFEFISEGPNGRIVKRVEYNLSESQANVFQLTLCDVDKSGEPDYLVVSNNGDRAKILATVVKTVREFQQIYPETWVFFEGNTDARTRLYRMAIFKNLEELTAEFHLFGLIGDKWISVSTELNYDAFLIQRKTKYL